MERNLAMTLVVQGREIDGELACEPVSTHEADRDRWFVLELYHLNSGAWLSHRTGMSNVYHSLDTTCMMMAGRQSGDPAGIDQLPDDAMPCPLCRPSYPQDLPDVPGPVARFEFPRHTWDECPTPELMVRKLITIRSRDGSIRTFMSSPVAELLRSAAVRYPEFGPLLNAAA
jgi:hypothetical protein